MSTELTPEVEALREKLGSIAVESAGTTTGMIYGKMLPGPKKLGGAQITEIIRTIVEELGITGECSCELSEGQCAHATRRELAAFTLLELAGKSP